MASSENTAAHEGTRFQTDVGQAETCKVEQIVIGLFFCHQPKIHNEKWNHCKNGYFNFPWGLHCYPVVTGTSKCAIYTALYVL